MFFVFCWKNSKRLFNKNSLFLFFIIPSVLISVLMFLQNLNFKNRPKFEPTKLESDAFPWNSIIENLKINDTRSAFNGYKNATGYLTSEDLHNKLNSTSMEYNNLAAIIFDESTINEKQQTNYFIRLSNPTQSIFSGKTPQIYKSTHNGKTFAENGFLSIQYGIEMSYLQEKLNGKSPNIVLNEMTDENLEKFNVEMLPMFSHLLLGTIVVINIGLLLLPIVEEKHSGIKEMVNLATAHGHLNYIALFMMISGGIGQMLILIVFEGISFYGVFNCASTTYLFLLMQLFIICIISFTFFVSIFFNTVTNATLVGSLFYLVPYVLITIQSDFGSIFRFLSPLILFNDGMTIVNDFLSVNICFSGDQLMSHAIPVQHYSLFEIYLSLIFTSILYIFLYFYLSNVYPGRYGTPKPFTFLFKRSYWFRERSNQPQTSPSTGVNKTNPEHSQGTKAIIFVKKLCKIFHTISFNGSKHMVVKDVNFEVPENRITILLGQNGAGKTTILSMIAGLLPHTSGDIVVDGEHDASVYCSRIGYCPQNITLMNYVTGWDHLIFFGLLRGLTREDAIVEADKLLIKLNLKDSARKCVHELSIGLKRRLSLACAVIGETKIVIFDEPSTGMDPESKRDFWDILLSLRKERTILMTTHSMEEADILGDKIVIVDNGTVVCEGSQLALKKKYGAGYTLKVVMDFDFNDTRTMEIIKNFVPNALVKSKEYPLFKVSLPHESIKNFSQLLAELEQNSKSLGIDTINVTNATMEDVFLNSAAENIPHQNDVNYGKSIQIPMDENRAIKSCFNIYLNQIMAIWYKKLIYIKKSWLMFTISCVFPMLAILSCFLIANFDANSFGNRLGFKSNYSSKFDLTGVHIENQQILLVINRNSSDFDHVVNSFKKLAIERCINPIIKSDISAESALRELKLENSETFNLKLLGAIKINNDITSLKILYQNNIIYSSSYMLNFVTNFILTMKFDDNSLIVHDWPLEGEYQTLTEELTMQLDQMNLNSEYRNLLPNFLSFGLFLYIVFYINLPFIEEHTDLRCIQNISSIHHWMTTYVIDCILHTIVAIVVVLLAWAFNSDNVIEPDSFIPIFGIICIYGYLYMPLMYLFTKLFKQLKTLYSMLFLIVFSGMIASAAIQDDISTDNHPIWTFLVRLLPDFHIRFELNAAIAKSESNFGDHSLVAFIIYSIIEIVLFLVIIIVVFENIYVIAWFQKIFSNPSHVCCFWREKTSTDKAVISNSIVEIEALKAEEILKSANSSEYSLVVSKLKKNFSNMDAVKGVDFTVKKGECFGLLGKNGAGKSSIFNILTLNTSASMGGFLINGSHWKNSVDKKQCGYCPGKCALLNFMSVYEQLKYMAWVNGTSYCNLDDNVNMWLGKMNLKYFKDETIEMLSGGTRRKINTAISMISDSFLCLLDEPTSGVDPVSRRYIWRCIRQLRTEMKTVVLTSQYMDECEELCNRLAIMTLGQFRTIGDLQQLKEIYGTGFTLVIKLNETVKEQEAVKIKKRMLKLYQCKLRDDFANTLIFNVEENHIQWSVAFAKIQEFCELYPEMIEDFSIAEVSLEDIFLQVGQNL